MEASEPKLVNPILNSIGVNLLMLGGPNYRSMIVMKNDIIIYTEFPRIISVDRYITPLYQLIYQIKH